LNAGEDDSQVSERVEEDFEDEENVRLHFIFHILIPLNYRLMEILIDSKIMNVIMVMAMERVVITNKKENSFVSEKNFVSPSFLREIF